MNYRSVFYVLIFSVIGKIDYQITKPMSRWDQEPVIGDNGINADVCYFNYVKRVPKTGLFLLFHYSSIQ